jgi:hypothetical protein
MCVYPRNTRSPTTPKGIAGLGKSIVRFYLPIYVETFVTYSIVIMPFNCTGHTKVVSAFRAVSTFAINEVGRLSTSITSQIIYVAHGFLTSIIG